METINLLYNDMKYQYQLDLLEQKRDFMLFLIENGMNNQTSINEVVSQWYSTWKASLIQNINTTTTQYKNFSFSQINKYEQWLKNNKSVILETKKYPVKVGANAKRFPNIQSALSRLSSPILKNINGLDLNRIQIGDKNNQLWLKKYLIPQYDGKSSFPKFVKEYYSGGDNKSTLNRKDTELLLKFAYQFCSDYGSTVNMIIQDANSIIAYINKDPITNQQLPPQSQAQQQLERKQQQGNIIASTNPYKNANMVKEAYSANTSPTPNTVNNTDTSNQINMITNKNNNLKTNLKKTPYMNTKQNQPYKKPNTDKINSDLMNKHKIVCETIKDVYNAKASAVALLYRDFMVVMQVHVSSYTNRQ